MNGYTLTAVIVVTLGAVANHQRYAEEVKAGLHGKGAKKAAGKKKTFSAATPRSELIKPPQKELFG